MTGREQRLVFGEDAELYDKARPAYPPGVIDAVVAMAGPPGATPRRAVEVGAGTGKATVGVAQRGLEITAVEPDAGMAAVLRRNVAAFPGVEVQLTGFESWDPGPRRYDLVYCAQAWHWIDPSVRYAKAAAALRPGGGLALFWHRTHWAEDDPVRVELDELYRRTAPELHAREPGFPGTATRHRGDGTLVAESAPWFGDPRTTTVPWPASFDTDQYTDLLRTQSDHRMVDPATLDALVAGVAELVAEHGGRIEIPYATLVFTARRLDR